MYTSIDEEVKTELSYTGFFSAGGSLAGKWVTETGRIKFFELSRNRQPAHVLFEAYVSQSGVPTTYMPGTTSGSNAEMKALCIRILPTVFVVVLRQLNTVSNPPDICRVLQQEHFKEQYADILDKLGS